MRRTFRLSGQRRFTGGFGIVIAATLLLILPSVAFEGDPVFRTYARPVLMLILVATISYLVLDLIFTRVVATEESVAAFNAFNRKMFELRIAEITSYRRGRSGSWGLLVGDQAMQLPPIEISNFHAFMASHASHALRATRWQCGQMPPAENYEDLLVFSVRSFIARVIAISLFGGVLLLLFQTPAVLGGIARPLISTLYSFRGLFERLTFGTDGVTKQTLFGRKIIRWDEVVSIFRDGPKRSRRFVLTAEDRSIVIPHHISTELGSMRKLLYSLPEGTLCVNFEPDWKSKFRGPGRRQRIGARALAPDFSPVPGAFATPFRGV